MALLTSLHPAATGGVIDASGVMGHEFVELLAREAPLDLLITATGILHLGEDTRPEKSMREIDPRSLAEVLAVNSIGPSLVTKRFLPTLQRDHKAVFAAFSARVGSISDNRPGGWSAY